MSGGWRQGLVKATTFLPSSIVPHATCYMCPVHPQHQTPPTAGAPKERHYRLDTHLNGTYWESLVQAGWIRVLLGEGTRDKADLRSTKQLSCLGSHSSEVGQLRETRTISFPRISQSFFVSFAEHRPTLLIIRITASSISNGVGGTDLTWTLSRVGSLFLRHKHCQLLSIRAAERQAPDSLIGPRAQQKTTKKKAGH
jgi:hypothetical protein